MVDGINTSMSDGYLNMAKLTQYLCVSRYTVLRLIKDGLPVRKLPSGYHLFKISEVESWLKDSESQRCQKSQSDS